MRVVSGIQPTGNLHLGNYLGAIRNWVRCRTMQRSRAANACSSSPISTRFRCPTIPAELTANTRAMAAALVACGIDPDRSILFNQARVPAHAEMHWLLNGTARMGWLNRMTQFKDKSGKNREGASVGAVHLSGAAGGRRAALPGDPRPGGRGPEAASRTGARHRAEVQQRLCAQKCRWLGRAGLHPARADHPAGRGARS